MKFIVTKEDFVEWKRNPVTVGVFDVLKAERIKEVNALIEGYTLAGEKTTQKTAYSVGKIAGLDLIFEYEVED